jgi:hypothetical protein
MTEDTPNGVDKAVIDLYGNPFYAALATVVETLRHAPYWHAEEKAPTRLDRARELVRNSRVLLQDERLASVYGSTKAYDVTGFHCTCPQSQKGPSAWCVHAVAVKLARTMAAQATLEAAPVALGTLRAGTLPLPPTTVDERLAQAPMPPEGLAALATQVALGTIHDATALQTHHMPQEDRMPDNEYLPEPDDQNTPVASVEPPAAVPALRPRTTQVDDLEAALQVWTTERAVVQRFLKTQMHEGNDFYSLRIKGRETKPVLSKAGSEKFLGLLQLHASFTQDTATWTMLGQPEGTLCYVCTLHNRNGEVVGEGRGARTIGQDGGDINKAIKMACKSAQVDAVLRTGALSDCFTQDLDDATPEQAKDAQPSADLRRRIWARVQEVAPEATTREDVTRVIMERTGLALHPDHYSEILAKLGA